MKRINPGMQDWWKQGRQSFTDLFKNINVNMEAKQQTQSAIMNPFYGMPLIDESGRPVIMNYNERIDEPDMFDNMQLTKE